MKVQGLNFTNKFKDSQKSLKTKKIYIFYISCIKITKKLSTIKCEKNINNILLFFI